MNNPDRHDHYLMKIAQEVRRVLSKDPNSIKLEQMKLEFEPPKPPPPPESRESLRKRLTAAAKVRWFTIVGKK